MYIYTHTHIYIYIYTYTYILCREHRKRIKETYLTVVAIPFP